MKKLISVVLLSLLTGCNVYEKEDASRIYNMLTPNTGIRLHVSEPQYCVGKDDNVYCVNMVRDTRLLGLWQVRGERDTLEFYYTDTEQLVASFSDQIFAYVAPYNVNNEYILFYSSDEFSIVKIEVFDELYMHFTLNGSVYVLVKQVDGEIL